MSKSGETADLPKARRPPGSPTLRDVAREAGVHVSTVSRIDSPLLTEDVDTLKLMTSALSRLAAVSKLRRVRVEFS